MLSVVAYANVLLLRSASVANEIADIQSQNPIDVIVSHFAHKLVHSSMLMIVTEKTQKLTELNTRSCVKDNETFRLPRIDMNYRNEGWTYYSSYFMIPALCK